MTRALRPSTDRLAPSHRSSLQQSSRFPGSNGAASNGAFSMTPFEDFTGEFFAEIMRPFKGEHEHGQNPGTPCVEMGCMKQPVKATYRFSRHPGKCRARIAPEGRCIMLKTAAWDVFPTSKPAVFQDPSEKGKGSVILTPGCHLKASFSRPLVAEARDPTIVQLAQNQSAHVRRWGVL